MIKLAFEIALLTILIVVFVTMFLVVILFLLQGIDCLYQEIIEILNKKRGE